ncbi:MAG: cation:proton antiporter, partial [Nitrospiraceae bacterium]|nr:cation:proton antiporter [Nitrospiraceae bacterium]
MESIVSIKPVLALTVSAIAALLIVYARHSPNLRESFSIGAGIIKFLIVLSMAPAVLAGGVIEFTLVTLLPGISISFRADALGLLFATTASFLWILATIYSIGYMRGLNEHAQTRFYACFAIALSSTIGVAFASNLFTLFLFYEILSLSTYPLVMHKQTAEAWKGGKMYLIYLVGASKSFFLAAVVLTYTLTGTLEFQRGGVFAGVDAPILLTIIYVLFIAGLAKAAIMPFHSWLPAAMVAPTPVS